jgi:hypothetical protein
MSVEKAKLTRSFVINYDLINEVVSYDNPDGMSYVEILGLTKYCEMMMGIDMMKDKK